MKHRSGLVRWGGLVAIGMAPVVWAAERYWIGSGGNWSDTANWSESSGGPGGASVPGTTNLAIFDANSGNCTIDVRVNVLGMHLRADFAGTVSQGANAITNRAYGWRQEGGTFQGGTGGITFLRSTNFTISGGTFKAGTQTIVSDLQVIWQGTNVYYVNYEGGTYQAESSKWIIRDQIRGWVEAPIFSITGSVELSEVEWREILGNWWQQACYVRLGTGTVVTVTNCLTFGTGTYLVVSGPGLFRAKGDVILGENMTLVGDGLRLVELEICGTGTQTLKSLGGRGLLPLRINKPSGTLRLDGVLETSTNWTYAAGIVDPGTSTVRFAGMYYSAIPILISGSHALNNVVLDHPRSWWGVQTSLNMTPGTVLTVNGDLTLISSESMRNNIVMGGAYVNTGVLAVKGNVSVLGFHFGGGTASLVFTGAQDQVYTQVGTNIPGGTVSINKSGGEVILATPMLVNAWSANGQQDLEWISGGLNIGTNRLEVDDDMFILPGAGRLTLAVSNATCFGRVLVKDDLSGIANAGLFVDLSRADPAGVAGQTFVIVSNKYALGETFASETFSPGWAGTITYESNLVRLSNVRKVYMGSLLIIE